MAKKHGPNKENLEATRRIFLEIARREFSVKGYYDASTANIVEASGMARGSLYYHFGDKKGLFRAVYEELMVEMQNSVNHQVMGAKDAWEAFMTGCMTLLDLCTQNETRRIIMDVHTALSYGERVEILSRTLLLELQTHLRNVLDAGYFKGHELRPLSMMIFGMISESGRSFELAEDIAKARKIVGETFTIFLRNAARA